MTSLPEDLSSGVTCPVLATPKCGYRGSGCVMNRGSRRSPIGLTGGEILPFRGHRGVYKDWCGPCPGLVSFKLVVPPLQPGAVGRYLVQNT
jgi:hypothetical protein